MTEISFYQIRRQPVERVLLRLLEKALAGGERAVVRLAGEAEAGVFDTALWTVDPDSFLPHGSANSKHPEAQPVYLTDGEDNPARAAFAFILPGAPAGGLEDFKRVFFLFDGDAQAEVTAARTHWRNLKGGDAKLTYWAQSETGRWEKK